MRARSIPVSNGSRSGSRDDRWRVSTARSVNQPAHLLGRRGHPPVHTEGERPPPRAPSIHGRPPRLGAPIDRLASRVLLLARARRRTEAEQNGGHRSGPFPRLVIHRRSRLGNGGQSGWVWGDDHDGTQFPSGRFQPNTTRGRADSPGSGRFPPFPRAATPTARGFGPPARTCRMEVRCRDCGHTWEPRYEKAAYAPYGGDRRLRCTNDDCQNGKQDGFDIIDDCLLPTVI